MRPPKTNRGKDEPNIFSMRKS